MKDMTLSKSQFIKGLQCPKALWLFRNRKELRKEPDLATKAIFEIGDRIGKLAISRYRGGREVSRDFWDVAGGAEDTLAYVDDGCQAIFEATAVHKETGDYARIDILRKVGRSDRWDLIEVKSSTRVKDYHRDDLAFQYYVFSGAGFNIRKCCMMVVDNSYERNGPVDPKKLLSLEDITQDVLERQAAIPQIRTTLAKTLKAADEPEMSIGTRCSTPHECEFKGYCWSHVPDYSAYDVYRSDKVDQVVGEHGFELETIPKEYWPGGRKELEIKSFLSDERMVDPVAISEFLDQIRYPLFFLDYEAISPTIPLYDGTRPFQQIPFQFSLHIQRKSDADLSHYEFLHKDASDPRRAFAEDLIRLCEGRGSIIVYNQTYEKTRNKELADLFPDLSDQLAAINDRMVDLLVPFRNLWLYDPCQHGSASIKAVLPAFTDLSYADLEIGNGGEAAMKYEVFARGDCPADELPSLWENLSRYCEQDTYAMVLLLDVLKKASW